MKDKTERVGKKERQRLSVVWGKLVEAYKLYISKQSDDNWDTVIKAEISLCDAIKNKYLVHRQPGLKITQFGPIKDVTIICKYPLEGTVKSLDDLKYQLVSMKKYEISYATEKLKEAKAALYASNLVLGEEKR